ncbi:hypothetical protein D779_0804 [Imhoffiella purpurea]|uniref:Uncharacterized protein n=1 Tax=Imhoffiella purpurea TaxID=1249627 RepID=W9VLS1_9GAMM|nr:hypothetical protein D779_0804 [Imhoffiella purpurea]
MQIAGREPLRQAGVALAVGGDADPLQNLAAGLGAMDPDRQTLGDVQRQIAGQGGGNAPSPPGLLAPAERQAEDQGGERLRPDRYQPGQPEVRPREEPVDQERIEAREQQQHGHGPAGGQQPGEAARQQPPAEQQRQERGGRQGTDRLVAHQVGIGGRGDLDPAHADVRSRPRIGRSEGVQLLRSAHGRDADEDRPAAEALQLRRVHRQHAREGQRLDRLRRAVELKMAAVVGAVEVDQRRQPGAVGRGEPVSRGGGGQRGAMQRRIRGQGTAQPAHGLDQPGRLQKAGRVRRQVGEPGRVEPRQQPAERRIEVQRPQLEGGGRQGRRIPALRAEEPDLGHALGPSGQDEGRQGRRRVGERRGGIAQDLLLEDRRVPASEREVVALDALCQDHAPGVPEGPGQIGVRRAGSGEEDVEDDDPRPGRVQPLDQPGVESARPFGIPAAQPEGVLGGAVDDDERHLVRRRKRTAQPEQPAEDRALLEREPGGREPQQGAERTQGESEQQGPRQALGSGDAASSPRDAHVSGHGVWATIKTRRPSHPWPERDRRGIGVSLDAGIASNRHHLHIK